VYIIVDALEQCSEEIRHILVDMLTGMGPTVNLMLTSRPHIDPRVFLSDFEVVVISAPNEDLRKYLVSQIEASSRLWKRLHASPELQEEIQTKVVSSANGM
jgi:hypothetical protein